MIRLVEENPPIFVFEITSERGAERIKVSADEWWDEGDAAAVDRIQTMQNRFSEAKSLDEWLTWWQLRCVDRFKVESGTYLESAILNSLEKHGATSEANRVATRVVAEDLREEPNNLKATISKMQIKKLIGSKDGRGGGIWIL